MSEVSPASIAVDIRRITSKIESLSSVLHFAKRDNIIKITSDTGGTAIALTGEDAEPLVDALKIIQLRAIEELTTLAGELSRSFGVQE